MRFWGFVNTPPRRYPDTSVYDQLATLAVWDSELWTGGGPPVLPLYWKLLPAGADVDTWRAVGNWTLSVVAWSLLALALAACIDRRWLRWAAAGLVLLFSCTFPVTQWDGSLLTESPSISLLALLVATCLRFLVAPTAAIGATMVGVALTFSLVRDTANYVAVALTGAVGIAVLLVHRRLGAAVTAGTMAVFALALALYALSPRGEGPLVNVVTGRVLDQPEMLRYFTEAGMPDEAALRKIRGEGHSSGAIYFQDARLHDFRAWLKANGRRTYVSFLLSHPECATRMPLREYGTIVAPHLESYPPPGARRILPDLIGRVVFPMRPNLVVGLVFAIFVAAVVLIRRAQRTWLVPILMIVTAVPHGMLVWHGDPSEISRHGLLVTMQLRLGALILAVFCLEAVLSTVRARR